MDLKTRIFQPEANLEKRIFLEEILNSVVEQDDKTYQMYVPKDSEESEKKYIQQTISYGLFALSGVTVRRVPQHILGNGVLGRAFIHSNYIEILDSLIGNEYNEVLTHEVLHILHPEKKEMDIRQMTRNYLGANNIAYH
jgi:hypothetical protein